MTIKTNYKTLVNEYLKANEGWVNVSVMGQSILGDRYTDHFKSVMRSIRTQIKDGALVSDGGAGRDMQVMPAEQAALVKDIRASHAEFEFQLVSYVLSLSDIIEALWVSIKPGFGIAAPRPDSGAFAEAVKARVPAVELMRRPSLSAWREIPSELLPPSVNEYFEGLAAKKKAADEHKIKALENKDYSAQETQVEDTARAEREAIQEQKSVDAKALQRILDDMRSDGIMVEPPRTP